ncbi:hypothetical protein HQQ94_03540 [Shewanella sp. VB17]|uniref:hypothetical protein n=1 Tax=Shewanella sp. VB17 TaxID=2739432 RepID=UPI001563DFB3|nr:hypothetical protein [Shewanella sp. VB17]NRD72329.1 hypothetical protein [Shewanella sp. VB17]
MNRILQLTSYIVLLTTFSFMAQAIDKEKITLALIDDPNVNLYTKWLHLVYSDALTRLNIDFSYVVMPAIRSSKMTDIGKVDGETARVATYGTAHPNMIRIEEPIFTANLSAYSNDQSIKINAWKDIQNSQYTVEYYRGIYLTHKRLTGYISSDRLTNSSTPSESLHKLIRPKNRGKIDLYIGVEQFTTELLTRPEFIGSNIQMIAHLENISFYGYLHQRHHDLAIKLAEVFRQMKSEGLLQTYFKQARQFIRSQQNNLHPK